MAKFVATFTHLGMKGRQLPAMTIGAESLDGFSTILEQRVSPMLGSRHVTVSARTDGTLTLTNHVGARVGTGRWRRVA